MWLPHLDFATIPFVQALENMEYYRYKSRNNKEWYPSSTQCNSNSSMPPVTLPSEWRAKASSKCPVIEALQPIQININFNWTRTSHGLLLKSAWTQLHQVHKNAVFMRICLYFKSTCKKLGSLPSSLWCCLSLVTSSWCSIICVLKQEEHRCKRFRHRMGQVLNWLPSLTFLADILVLMQGHSALDCLRVEDFLHPEVTAFDLLRVRGMLAAK